MSACTLAIASSAGQVSRAQHFHNSSDSLPFAQHVFKGRYGTPAWRAPFSPLGSPRPQHSGVRMASLVKRDYGFIMGMLCVC